MVNAKFLTLITINDAGNFLKLNSICKHYHKFYYMNCYTKPSDFQESSIKYLNKFVIHSLYFVVVLSILILHYNILY
jgi:hypothetical protein